MKIELYNEDCKETMKRIQDGSIDLMLTDIPYGTTACEWDVLPNLTEMWLEWERILKPNGKWVFTCSQPVTSSLIMSRLGFFKYELIWFKSHHSDFALGNIRPHKRHENILIFERSSGTYNPQKWNGKPNHGDNRYRNDTRSFKEGLGCEIKDIKSNKNGVKNPHSVLFSNCVDRAKSMHPTQKPTPLMRYLVATYSNEGETVYDGYSGSGTTAIACIMEKRNFIGAELNKEYYDKAKKRIDAKLSQPALF